VLSLDEIAEALGTLRVSADEIDQLFAWLEAEGRIVGEAPGAGAATTLQQVLAVARALRAELGRAPHPREIAEHSGLSVAEVQRALLFARILQR
jgi:DNA-directed RNA polymerase sigma subunit (sigma70/sigma32)